MPDSAFIRDGKDIALFQDGKEQERRTYRSEREAEIVFGTLKRHVESMKEPAITKFIKGRG